MAARTGSIPCLALFLENGASINAVDLENWTVLNEAVKYNQIETVRYVIEKGGDVGRADDDAWTPLHVAGRFGIVGAVEPLVAAGGDINAVTEDRETPLLLACSQSGHASIVRELLKHGANPQLVPLVRSVHLGSCWSGETTRCCPPLCRTCATCRLGTARPLIFLP